jgi:hypothetical protein
MEGAAYRKGGQFHVTTRMKGNSIQIYIFLFYTGNLYRYLQLLKNLIAVNYSQQDHLSSSWSW